VSLRVAAAAGPVVPGVGAPVALALLLPSEAGIPVPIPADLLMLLVGERAAAGAVPLWLAVVVLEAVTIVGTTTLFLLARGPGRSVIGRLGPRIGLTEERLARAAATVERRGRRAVILGRGTPGLRTVTVLASAVCGLRPSRVLPALWLGSTVFVQGHLVLGYVAGTAAADLLESARGPIVAGLVVLAAAGAVVWFVRRGRRGGPEAWAEASCPACLAIGALVTGVDAVA